MSRPLSLKRHRPTADDLARQCAVRAQKPQQLHTPPLTPERPTVVRVTMPRQLATPDLAPVSSQALVNIDPALANIPVGFIRQRVLAMAPDIWEGLISCTPKTMLTSPLPRTMEVVARNPDIDASMLPTHYLLVYNHRTPNERGRLYPANSLVLATQCASLPRFGPTTRELREDNTFEVPIVAFSIPCPGFFHPLYLYLNTQNVNNLLASLIPLPTPALDKIKFSGTEGDQVPERLAESLSDWLSIRALLSTLKTCHGVWSNACALQVNDDRLWRVISYAWNIVIMAVERSSGRPAPPVESIADAADADAVDRELGDAPPPYDA